MKNKWNIAAFSPYKVSQFDMISDSHVSWPLFDINTFLYDDIYGFHYILQHSIDFEIYSTYMNCPWKHCHYSCLYKGEDMPNDSGSKITYLAAAWQIKK